LTLPFDLNRTRNNADALVSFARTNARVARGASYFQSLDLLQFRESSLAPWEMQLVFSYERPGGNALRDVLLASPELPPEATSTPLPLERQAEVAATVAHARVMLREVHPEAERLIETLLALVVVTRVQGVASASFAKAVGVAWLSPGDAWTTTDFAEHLLHEACHQELFLDEMVNGLFATSRVTMRTDAQATVRSPIRGTPRTYAASFHGAAVGVYLVWLFHGLGLASRARELLHGLDRSFEELFEKRRYLTENGVARLTHLRDCFESYTRSLDSI